MKSPNWITFEECLALHDFMLSQYGGRAGVRDEGLLKSALSRPQQILTYSKPTLAQMAAAYTAGIIKNHPFIDGNKRTGFMMGTAFLELNGHTFFATETDAALKTLALAAGKISEEDYAKWMEENSNEP